MRSQSALIKQLWFKARFMDWMSISQIEPYPSNISGAFTILAPSSALSFPHYLHCLWSMSDCRALHAFIWLIKGYSLLNTLSLEICLGPTSVCAHFFRAQRMCLLAVKPQGDYHKGLIRLHVVKAFLFVYLEPAKPFLHFLVTEAVFEISQFEVWNRATGGFGIMESVLAAGGHG